MFSIFKKSKNKIEESLRVEFESKLSEKIERCLSVDHQWIIAAHHFAPASAECIKLFRDGYFIATVMMSHSINEGIIKFVAERNSINCINSSGDQKDLKTLVDELKNLSKISPSCADSMRQIYGSFRNDIHHMNPKISTINFRSLAKKNIENLTSIEKEIFDVVTDSNGMMKPCNPIYWDIESGYAPAFIQVDL